MGTQELLIVLAIVLILFGAKKLPELSRSLGTSIKEFRKASDDTEDDEHPTKTTGSADGDS